MDEKFPERGAGYESGAVERAGMSDLEDLFGLFDAANALSLKKSGVWAWRNPDVSKQGIKECLEARDVYILRDPQRRISASITLGETSTEWGSTGLDNQALYFTKYMKNPTRARAGEPLELLRFAAREATRRDRPWLRCDAVMDQANVVEYYQRTLGFMAKGSIEYPGSGRRGILLETLAVKLSACIGILRAKIIPEP
jgi:hypothetical protein